MKFSDMMGWSPEMRAAKADYKAFDKRVNALPEAYKFVFKAIRGYFWEFGDPSGEHVLTAMKDLLELFEGSSAEGVSVFDIVGEDVATFANDILGEVENTWMSARNDKMNATIAQFMKENPNE